jgi:nucleotide-binding universal stress UspA family protein
MNANTAVQHRVVVGVSGSLSNLAALHAAVAEARRTRAPLVAILAWTPVGGELSDQRAACPPLLAVWRQQARTDLNRAFDDAFGGVPTDIQVESTTVRGEAGPTLVGIANRPGDLMIVGSGRRSRFARLRHTSVSRYCLSNARCPLLVVPPPALIEELKSSRRWRADELVR